VTGSSGFRGCSAAGSLPRLTFHCFNFALRVSLQSFVSRRLQKLRVWVPSFASGSTRGHVALSPHLSSGGLSTSLEASRFSASRIEPAFTSCIRDPFPSTGALDCTAPQVRLPQQLLPTLRVLQLHEYCRVRSVTPEQEQCHPAHANGASVPKVLLQVATDFLFNLSRAFHSSF
jgi:hypothetical protein